MMRNLLSVSSFGLPWILPYPCPQSILNFDEVWWRNQYPTLSALLVQAIFDYYRHAQSLPVARSSRTAG